MNRKILVLSHERSGTHFLINSIALNIGYSCDQIDFPMASQLVHGIDKMNPVSPLKFKDYQQVLDNFITKNHPDNFIFKSHHHIKLFQNLDSLFENFHVFYITRDVRDVLTSCYYYFNNAPAWFPHENDIEKFILQTKPHLHGFNYDYTPFEYENLIERYIDHNKTWLNESRVNVVRYEDLVNNFGKELVKILKILELPVPEYGTKPTVSNKGVNNRKGIVGDYKNVLTKNIISKLQTYESIV